MRTANELEAKVGSPEIPLGTKLAVAGDIWMMMTLLNSIGDMLYKLASLPFLPRNP